MAMRFLRSFLSGRFRGVGLLSDLAMVAAAASRVARRPAGGSSAGGSARSSGEWFLVAGAAFRLLRRIRQVRRKRRITSAAD